MAEEAWADIPGYEGWYQASTSGRIRRIRKVHWNHGKKNIVSKEHILIPSVDHKGYQVVIVSNPDTGVKKHVKVHRLVALTFLDNPYGYGQIDHINRDKCDNSIDNLRWCDQYSNMNNRNANRFVSAFGMTMTLTEWGLASGLKPLTIRARLERGWTPEQAVSVKPLKEGEKICLMK